MNESSRSTSVLFTVGLGVVLVLGLAFTAYMISDSWGAGYAVVNGVVGTLVSLLALVRGVDRFRTAVAGVAVAALAVVVSLVADLPQEPGPVTGLALAVLVGAAIRTLPARTAAAVGAGGLLVVVGSWLSARDNQGGLTAVTLLDALGWLAAVTAGLTLRAADARQRPGSVPAPSPWTQSTRAR